MEIDWKSQLAQDRFVVGLMNGKRGGTYIDIGAGDPIVISNTWVLEHHFGWRGVLCDIEHEAYLLRARSGNTVVGDAMNADWEGLFHQYAVDGWIDYLSLDLEPPELACELLQQLPMEKYRFRIATVEHDSHRPGGRRRMYEIGKRMFDLGYEYMATAWMKIDGQKLDIEDWWVHRDAGLELAHIGSPREERA